MREIKFLQFLPTLLIGLTGLLWVKTLVFDKPTNSTERKLEQFWTANFERAEPLLTVSNTRVRNEVHALIYRREDDKPILNRIDSIFKYGDIVLEALEETQKDTAAYAIILRSYEQKIKSILDSANIRSPLITDEETEAIFNQVRIGSFLNEKNKELQRLWLRSRITQNNSRLVNYFASKIGGMCCGCFWNTFQPVISLNSNLKVGEQTTGKIALNVSNHYLRRSEYASKYHLKINGKPQEVKYGVAQPIITFSEATPKKLHIETTRLKESYEGDDLKMDTMKFHETITLYPSKY